MTKPPSLAELLKQRHDYVLRNLRDAASFISHPTEKGDATEQVWLDALKTYLPTRYDARRGFVIDSSSSYSKQLDIIVHDRFYTPFILKVGGYHVIPVESVYAVFEVKQTLDSKNIKQAREKAQSVRVLKRSYRATKQVPDHSENHILAGILTTRSSFPAPLGGAATEHMRSAAAEERLDYVCVGETGWAFRRTDDIEVESGASSITSFMLHLIATLQESGTVPPINIDGYRCATIGQS